MQQLTAPDALHCLTDLGERRRHGSGAQRDGREEEQLLCPKPRRLAIGVSSAAAEIIKPSRRLRSHASLLVDGEAGLEILDILYSKGVAVIGDSGNSSCCASPPHRAGNPVIHDVQFTQKRAPLPLIVLPEKSSCTTSNSSFKKSCGSSYGANPSVRVEGFMCSSSDSHRGVPALA